MSGQKIKVTAPPFLVRWLSLTFFILATADVGGLLGAAEPGFSLTGLVYAAFAAVIYTCFWTIVMVIDGFRDRANDEEHS